MTEPMLLKALEIAGCMLRPQFRDSLLTLAKSGLVAGNGRHWSSGAQIHPSAIIHEGTKIDENVTIGPYCVVGEGVILGSGCKLLSHVSIHSNTILGNNTVVHPFASVGGDPQDLKYKDECSWLVLGAKNVVREHASINRGTAGGGGFTQSGHSCLFMSGTHIGHDCMIGDHVILSTGAGLAGHVIVDDEAIIGGLAGVKQRVHIGRGAMVGGKSAVLHDVLPYTLVTGNPAHVEGLNLVGLRRRQVSKEEIKALSECLNLIHGDSSIHGSLAKRVETMRRTLHPTFIRVEHLMKFMQRSIPRGICHMRKRAE